MPIFLNIFDEGKLSESATGQVADFSKSIIFLTSNLANDEIGRIADNPSLNRLQKELQIKDILCANGLAKELLGRIDRILVYNPLDDNALELIIANILSGYNQYSSEKAKELLEKYRQSTSYGIRDLIRQVENDIMGFGDRDYMPKIILKPVEQISGPQIQTFLKKRIIGQDKAIELIATDIAINAQKKIDKPSPKPIAVFLGVGPTGVGKTETAKALAGYMKSIDPRYELTSFDMSEFHDEHTVARFVGSPPGYIGSDKAGQLTGPMRDNPLRVILFDEIEKADPSIMNLFLQIFDEGRLTDTAQGFQVGFDDTIIFMTSNLASAQIGEILFGNGTPVERRKRILDTLQRAGIKPEVLARINSVVPYRFLDKPDYVEIVKAWFENLPDIRKPKDSQALAEQTVEETKELMAYGVREIMRAAEKKVYTVVG
jgi:ATP-dependent Clp protease ATP-binding subunit ClpA